MGTTAIESITQLGVCVKALDGTVQFQNEVCRRICGNQVGKRCLTGCMQRLKGESTEPSSIFDSRFSLIKNIDSAKNHVDAVIVNDGNNLISLLYEKDEVIREQMAVLQKYNLSKSELHIMEKLLHGLNNRQIAKELCICKQTLRTHLNNIYKKLPVDLRTKIHSIHAHQN